MKQILRYRFLTISKKLYGEIRLTIDERNAAYHAAFDGGTSVQLRAMPFITLGINRPMEQDENGRTIRPPFNPNDSIGMTKFNLPIFIENLARIKEDMKTSDLYTYHGKRLEINPTIAERVRRVFTIGNVVVEFSATILTPDDESRLEGIKVKFNNEDSSFTLSLNEMISLLWNLDHLDVDGIALAMYTKYGNDVNKGVTPSTSFNSNSLKSIIDIAPKEDDFSD